MRYLLCLFLAALIVSPAASTLPQSVLVGLLPQVTLPDLAEPELLPPPKPVLCDCDPCTCQPGRCTCAKCPCPEGQNCKPVVKKVHDLRGAYWSASPHAGEWALIVDRQQVGGWNGYEFRWLENGVWSDPVKIPIPAPVPQTAAVRQVYVTPVQPTYGAYGAGCSSGR